MPVKDPKHDPKHLEALERWLRSYRPEELFDGEGRPERDLVSLCPEGPKRIAMNPVSFGGDVRQPLSLPPLERFAVPVERRGSPMTSHMGPLATISPR